MTAQLLITCEHGGNRIPAAWRQRVVIPPRVLASHLGYDRGSLAAARHLAEAIGAPLVFSEVSRLLVELNRSLGHPRLFSRYAQHLPPDEKQALLDTFYRPFREEVRAIVEKSLAAGRPVVHVSVHSFTPLRRGERRADDLGLLYDPSRPPERATARSWREALRAVAPEWRMRFNWPYLGTADGHTTSLRKQFAADEYQGIELEINQRIVRGSAARFEALQQALAKSLGKV